MRAPLRNLTALFAAVLVAASAPAPAEAQERTILSSRVSVSSDDASLELEFADGGTTAVGLRNGRVVVDGQTLGSYEPGSALDHAWRDLLSEAVLLDDGPLARALREWSPPADLPQESAGLASRIDASLESALSPPAARDPQASETADAGTEDDLARLLRRTERLPGLAGALEGLEHRDLRLRVGENVEVGADERIDGTLIVVDGDLTVRGEITGNVVVTGGTLRIEEGGRIGGEARLVDAGVDNRGGTVVGAVRTLPARPPSATPPDVGELEERIRREVRAELDEVRAFTGPASRGSSRSALSRWIAHVVRGITGIVETVVTFLVLALLGLAVIRFAPENLHAVSDAVRRSPARSAAVGAAGVVLLLPAWILGMVALAISIVGLVGLPFWIVLFPFAAILAAGLGYLAVAQNVGQWIVAQRLRWMEGLQLRSSNAVHTLVTGLVVLLSLYLAGHVMELFGGFLGFLEALLMGTAALVTLVATVLGFGAVLLTRGGRRPDPGSGSDFLGDSMWPRDPGPGPRPDGPTEPGFGHTGGRTGPETQGATASTADRPSAAGRASAEERAPGEDAPDSTARGEDDPTARSGADPTPGTAADRATRTESDTTARTDADPPPRTETDADAGSPDGRKEE